MTNSPSPDPADLDRVALAALEHVETGMRLGLGTGRAAEAFIVRLGERVKRGLSIKGVPTSERSKQLARSVGIDVVTLADVEALDIAFDGADEVTPELDLTKGLGGALLRERVVAHEARNFIVLVTPEKLVEKLGTRTAIPIEVVPFAEASASRHLARLGGRVTVRLSKDEKQYFSDNHNLILDTAFGPIVDPKGLNRSIRSIPGVVDTGLFLEMANVILVGDAGRVRKLERG